jgi:hypothetical protein
MKVRDQDKQEYKQEQSAPRSGTAYVVTFPNDAGGLGHTSLYVEGSDGSSFQRSYFPSTRYAQHTIHNASIGTVPVFGFITKGLDSDVKYENGPPSSIKKIEGLDYDSMLEENQNFNSKLETGNHFFSIRYNSVLNPMHWLITLGNSLMQSSIFNGPFVDSFDDSIIDYTFAMNRKEDEQTDLRNEQSKITFGNCTEAVNRSLQAGGFKLEQSSKNWFLSNFFANGHTPTRYNEDIEASGGIEMIDKPEQLPQKIRFALEKGRDIYQKRDFEQEKRDQQHIANFKRFQNYQ